MQTRPSPRQATPMHIGPLAHIRPHSSALRRANPHARPCTQLHVAMRWPRGAPACRRGPQRRPPTGPVQRAAAVQPAGGGVRARAARGPGLAPAPPAPGRWPQRSCLNACRQGLPRARHSFCRSHSLLTRKVAFHVTRGPRSQGPHPGDNRGQSEAQYPGFQTVRTRDLLHGGCAMAVRHPAPSIHATLVVPLTSYSKPTSEAGPSWADKEGWGVFLPPLVSAGALSKHHPPVVLTLPF